MKRTQARERNAYVGTGRDPQYGRYRADVKLIAQLNQDLRREMRGESPWREEPRETALTPLSVACCFGGRLLFTKEPIRSFLRWASLVVPEIDALRGSRDWMFFADHAANVADDWDVEVFRDEENELRRAFASFTQPATASLGAEPSITREDLTEEQRRLVQVYRALFETHYTRALIMPVVQDLNESALAHADALFRVVLEGEYRLLTSSIEAFPILEGYVGASMRRTDLDGVKIYNADMRGADLDSANILGQANLRNADLRGANLRNANMYQAYLLQVNFQDAILYDANLRRAYLDRADFRFADLRGASLFEASLRDADLRNADLREVDLRSANLSGADLTEARRSVMDDPVPGWRLIDGLLER